MRHIESYRVHLGVFVPSRFLTISCYRHRTDLCGTAQPIYISARRPAIRISYFLFPRPLHANSDTANPTLKWATTAV
jgi:hypothetical protein